MEKRIETKKEASNVILLLGCSYCTRRLLSKDGNARKSQWPFYFGTGY